MVPSQGGRAVMGCVGSGDLPFKAIGAELPGRHSSPSQRSGSFTAVQPDVRNATHCFQSLWRMRLRKIPLWTFRGWSLQGVEFGCQYWRLCSPTSLAMRCLPERVTGADSLVPSVVRVLALPRSPANDIAGCPVAAEHGLPVCKVLCQNSGSG